MFPQPKGRPRILDKRDDQREHERLERQVAAEVDARDLKRCRCCGRRGDPYAVDPLGRIHRHHIRPRSRGGSLSSANLVSLCARCHALVHARQLFVIGTNANHRIEFDVHEAAVVEIFGTKPIPPFVHIIC